MTIWSGLAVPPMANPSVVGFAEAELLVPEVCKDLARRVEAVDDGGAAPEEVVGDIAALVLAAVEAANSLHFRFDLTVVGGPDGWTVVRRAEKGVIHGLDTHHPNRKLTVVLPLLGRATVDFDFVDKRRSMSPGRIAMFPAFLANELHPEDGSQFVAILAYGVGPSFA